ncbi:MAG: YitT family protein [Bacteroidetes bacterium]|nr:YitT family protein [Bacteroidota bacterium]MBS1973738.1 YitT family protein [Bacteroidota bacterium]
MQYESACDFVMSKLRAELPSYLTYHNAEHTDYVIASAVHIAELEHVAGDDLLILKTAALFHDAGYLKDYKDHEELSCAMATKHLPDFEYSPEQIDRVCAMIRATKMPQAPQDHLSKILCDADLYYLGTNHYLDSAHRLYKELKKTGQAKAKAEWQLKQVEFLKGHQYFIKKVSDEQKAGKEKNIVHVQKQIEATIHHQKNTLSMMIEDAFLILFGVILSSFAINFFLLPNQLIDGGVTGIYLLIQGTRHVSSLLIIPLNIPLVILSYFSVNKRFAVLTFISIALLGACMYFFHLFHIPDFSGDKLLMSIFGGVFLGMGIGFVMRAGAALDGIEVLALYTLKKTSFTITEIILGINIIIFSIAAYVFSIETALYSILTYFAATRTIDYVVEGIQAYTGVTIISGKSEIIKYQLVNELGRGITIYKGERGFLPGKFEISEDCDIIFTVVTRLELRRLKNVVHAADPKAFVFANTIKEASGGILRRKHEH